MEDALGLCGFHAATIQSLVTQGFVSSDDLLLASESDLDLIARAIARTSIHGGANVTMPFIALKNLKGFRFWADERKRTGFDADPENFTEGDVGPFTAKCQEYNNQREAAKDKDASKPDSLKKLTNWALWNESFQNYLRQILNDKETPEVLNPEDFASPTEYLIEATILRGRHFELDNPRLDR